MAAARAVHNEGPEPNRANLNQKKHVVHFLSLKQSRNVPGWPSPTDSEVKRKVSMMKTAQEKHVAGGRLTNGRGGGLWCSSAATHSRKQHVFVQCLF